ncbi:MAG: hypothetical protein K6U80_02960 [Firmicutes bacterium]|nr:hypothetical protein [Bacillota bacterium]
MQFGNVSKKIFMNKIFWALLFLLILDMVYVNRFSLVLKDPVLLNDSGNRTAITLPFKQKMAATEYSIAGKIFYHGFFSAKMVQIIPQDEVLSIRVNNHDVSLNQVNPAALRDPIKGFHFNLGRHLQEGANILEIRIRNNGIYGGLIFQNSPYDFAHCLMLILALAILYLILSSFISNKVFIFILLGGFVMRWLYFLITPYYIREYDVDGHIHYIDYILKHGSIPARNEGWETFQPPLYYLTAAFIYKVANLLGVQSTFYLYRVVQFLSLLFSMGFLLASLLIFKETLTNLSRPKSKKKKSQALSGPPERSAQPAQSNNDWIIALMLSLITFWPSGIIHSARIGNDPMFYFLYAWGLFFLVKWRYDQKDRNLYASFVLTTLCFITKANALVLYGVTGIIYLWNLIKKRNPQKYLFKTAILLIIFSMGFMITFGASVAEKLNGSKAHFLAPNMPDLGPQEVGNRLINYLWFDLPSFINEPYVYSWEEKAGRQYFWNFNLKTALISEFHFDSAFHRTSTFLLTIIFLGMILFVITGLVMILRKEFKKHLILFLNLILLYVAAVLFRYSIPASCAQDFRYIFPALISFCFFYGYALLFYRRKGWVRVEAVGYTLAVLFIGLSIPFFTGLQF